MKNTTGERNIISGNVRHPILLGFIAFVCYYIVFQLFYNKIAEKSYFPYRDFYGLLRGVALNFTPIFALFISDVSIIFRFNRIKDIRWKLPVDFLLTNVAAIFVNAAFLFIMSGTVFDQVDWAGSLFNNFILFFTIETFYYVFSFRQKEREIEEQESVMLRYQYNTLKAQVNPHFLFNSLNILTALISIDHQKAVDFVTWLSQVYRYTMTKQDVELATLNEELSFMHSYISILSMRYHGKFEVRIKGEENVGRQFLIPYTLQLLIENITKHNVISSRLPMTVDIEISKEEMTITNPVHPRASEAGTHFGLSYLTRLYRYYGKDFHTSNDGKTFTAFIPYIYPNDTVRNYRE